MLTRSLWFYLTVLVVAIAVTWYAFYGINTSTQVAQSNKNQEANEAQIDAYMTHFSTRQYDKQGQLEYNLQSPKASHYANNGISRLTEPFLIIYQEQKAYRNAKAQIGWIYPNNKLMLEKKVVIKQILPKSNKTTLTTESITINTEKGLAQTDQPIVITQNQGVTHAVGMTSHYKLNRMQLKSKVKGTYEIR